MLAGIVREVRPEAFAKASDPMVVALDGIVTEVSLVALKNA
jgi:hypothetical protein